MRFFQRRDLHALAGAYALDALDGAERDRFERHLRGCRACQDEVRGFAATAAALAMATAAEPPPGLKQRVLAAAAVARQSPPAVASVTGAAGRRRPRTTAPRWSWLPRLAVPVAAAGLAAAAVLGGVTVWTQHQLTTVQAENQAIAAVLAAPDAQIASAPTTAGGSATVVASHNEGKMVFTSSGLRALPPVKVYELWYLRPGSARPAGLVPSAIAGRTPPVLASGLAVGDKVGVTVEPAGGTSSPTTTPIVVLTLSA